MELIRFEIKKEIFFVYLDNKLKVVALPSLYLMSIQNDGLRHSLKSIEHYSKVFKYFLEYLEKKYNYPVDRMLETLNGTVISKYLKSLKEKGLAPATIRNREAIIRNLLTWLTTEEAGYVRKNNGYSSTRYKSPSPLNRTPKYLTVFEIIDFMNLLHEESQRCLVHFFFDSGLRISEIPRVKKTDIPNLDDFPADTMYFDLDVKGSKGRGGNIKDRKTYLTRTVIQRINRLHNQNATYKKVSKVLGKDMPCFLNVKGEKLTENAIKNLLYKTSKRGGLDSTKYSSHKYRHSFAVSVLMSEFDEDYLNKLVITKNALGHNDMKTTEVYSLISPSAIKYLQKKTKEHDILNRFEASEFIYEQTYLPMKKHKEKRGRS